MLIIVAYFVQMCNLVDVNINILEIRINKIVLEPFHDDDAGGEPRKKRMAHKITYQIVLNICFLFINVHTNNLHAMLKK